MRETKTIHEKDGKKDMTFEEVYEQYQNLCKSLAWQVAKRYGLEAEIEDLTQIAYIAMWRGYENYNSQRTVGFAHYIEKVIWSRLERHARRMIRHRNDTDSIYEKIPESDNLILLDQLNDDVDIEEIAIGNSAVQKIFDTLDERDKEIFEYLIAGFPRYKIAQKLGISHQRVSQRIQKIKKKLKEVI